MTSPEVVAPPAHTKLRFSSGEAGCAAVHIRPDASEPAPCVILGHGFGAVKEGGPIRSAERFAEAGFSCLAFDYRYFGESEGEPRQLIDINRQLEDWRAAIAYARGLEGVDPGRIALWGSSFSGGHVFNLAAEDSKVRAVVSQAPHIDGIKTLQRLGPANATRLTLAALRDAVGGLLGAKPYRIPIVGPPGTTAAMTTPDAESGYDSIYDEDFPWRNDCLARIALPFGVYRPGRSAKDIQCPILVQVCSDDSITPPAPAIKAAGAAPKGELVVYAGIGHFEIYRGDHFERAVADQTAFLTKHLGPPA